MNILIAGAGRVGFSLARTLSIGHNVTVIDKNTEALQRLQESLDILPLHGDIEDPKTYRKLIDRKADLFIAVTDLDEANLISTLIIDDQVKVDRKMIRLRNAFFDTPTIRRRLGVDDVIFPLRLISRTVTTLLDYPKANNVKTFQYTDKKLISVRVNRPIKQDIVTQKVVIVGAERQKRFLFISNFSELHPGDLLYLFGDEEVIQELCRRVDTQTPTQIGSCVIFGAKELGVTIARALIEKGVEVKLIDKETKVCEIAEERLEGKAMAISYRYGTADLFEEEGLAYADMMIAATNDDEYNIIKCLEAKEYGMSKVIAINNEQEYYNLMHALGIVVVRGPKMGAYNDIIERIGSNRVVFERHFCGGKAVVFMRKIFDHSHLIGKQIAPLKAQECVLFLLRDEILLPFHEPWILQANDLIVGFASHAQAPQLKVWLYEL